MKKIVLLLGVIASVVVLSGCANKDSSNQAAVNPAPEAPHHHDLKGEVSK